MNPIKRLASDCQATKLNKEHLDNESGDQDSNKDPVIEEVFKNIEGVTKLSAVDLIENLHEYKCLEQDRVVCCFVQLIHCLGAVGLLWHAERESSVSIVRQIENVFSTNKNNQEPSDLVD